MKYAAAIFLALVCGQSAHALVNNQAQNRVHVGGAWTPGNAQVQLGFDSRLTNSIFVNVGALRRPVTPQILAVTALGYFATACTWTLAFESPTGTRGS